MCGQNQCPCSHRAAPPARPKRNRTTFIMTRKPSTESRKLEITMLLVALAGLATILAIGIAVGLDVAGRDAAGIAPVPTVTAPDTQL
jgi:hypothetical protein